VRGLLGAVSFLTRVPTGTGAVQPAEMARFVPWFPLVGALVGAAVGGLYAGASALLPPLVAAAVAVTAGVAVTGAFHEDGLGDTADAFVGGGDRVPRLDQDAEARASVHEIEHALHLGDRPHHGEQELVGAGVERQLHLVLRPRAEAVDPAEDARAGRGPRAAQVVDGVPVDLGVGRRLPFFLAVVLPVHDDSRDPAYYGLAHDGEVRGEERELEGIGLDRRPHVSPREPSRRRTRAPRSDACVYSAR